MAKEKLQKKIEADLEKPKWKTFGISVFPEQYEWLQKHIKGKFTLSEYFRMLIRNEIEREHKPKTVLLSYNEETASEWRSVNRPTTLGGLHGEKPSTIENEPTHKSFGRSLNESNKHAQTPQYVENDNDKELSN